jgi:hypothetical protein
VRNTTAAVVLLMSAFLGVGVGLVLVRREHLNSVATARERAAAARLEEVAHCLTLVRWTLEPLAEDGALVRAEVLPGRDGRVALDAHGSRGGEDILVPELQTERLVPAVVHSAVPVFLERRLRRVRVGVAEEMALRFSCRPPGPQGVFGVIEYNTSVPIETPDGFGGLLRPLPSPEPGRL